MERNTRALGYLGLARRGGRIAVGEESAGAACRSGHGRLLVLAEDAGDHTFRRAQSFARSGKPPVVTVPFTKAELGGALGLTACAIAVITDAPLALAFVEALGEDAALAPVRQVLTAQKVRIEKRRKEEQAHRKNVRRGKK